LNSTIHLALTRAQSRSDSITVRSNVVAACFLIATLVVSGCGGNDASWDRVDDASWDEVVSAARGTRVYMKMWTGDSFINRYMKGYVTRELRERYDIDLNVVSGQGSQIVTSLMTELEAGAATSASDLVWINGETFYQLRQLDALYGPFVDRLPNSTYVDFGNRFIGRDFQQDIDGYESPWGNVQFVMIYDSARVASPPTNRVELARWVRGHPGRFTFDSSFTGMTFLKGLLIAFAGGPGELSGPFNEGAYTRASEKLWTYLESLRPYFWKHGETYPSSVARLHQLFLNGEVDFSMSNNDAEVENKVLQGLFPSTVRAYIMDEGSIQNSHYVGIPRLSGNKAGALVVANFLLSSDAQLKKSDPSVWGDGTVLDLSSLPDTMQSAFRAVRSEIRQKRPDGDRGIRTDTNALEELDATYMIRLFDDFRVRMVER